jgi:hypothetical protein
MAPAVRYLPICRQRMEPEPVHVGFVTDKVTLEQVFIPVLQSSPVNIIPRMFQTLSLLSNIGAIQS